MKFVFYTNNFWGYPIYKNKDNIPIVKLEEGYFSLSDNNDIDSDPCHKLNNNKIEIVKEL